MRGGSGACGNATKDTAGEKASTLLIEKSTGVWWHMEHP